MMQTPFFARLKFMNEPCNSDIDFLLEVFKIKIIDLKC